MFIPGSIGQLTGWRAVLACVVIVGVIGLGVWGRMQPRSFGHGTITIEPDHAYFYSFTANHSATLKAEFVPQGATAASAAYTVYVVDEANKVKYENPVGDLKDVQTLVKEQAVGALTIPRLRVTAGMHYAIIENPGKTPIQLQYKFYELAN